MSKSSLAEADVRTVNEIIVAELEIAEEEITNEAAIMDDLGADSLAVIEIGMALEDRFNISIPDQEWEKVRTVGDLHETLANLLPVRR